MYNFPSAFLISLRIFPPIFSEVVPSSAELSELCDLLSFDVGSSKFDEILKNFVLTMISRVEHAILSRLSSTIDSWWSSCGNSSRSLVFLAGERDRPSMLSRANDELARQPTKLLKPRDLPYVFFSFLEFSDISCRENCDYSQSTLVWSEWCKLFENAMNKRLKIGGELSLFSYVHEKLRLLLNCGVLILLLLWLWRRII